jgi:hypothetical protein
MTAITDALRKFFASTRTYIFFTTLLSGAVAFELLDQQQADALLKAAVELGIAFFGSAWTNSVGSRDVGQH